jgi:hypothetical protein
MGDNLFQLMSHEANHALLINGLGRAGTYFMTEAWRPRCCPRRSINPAAIFSSHGREATGHKSRRCRP